MAQEDKENRKKIPQNLEENAHEMGLSNCDAKIFGRKLRNR